MMVLRDTLVYDSENWSAYPAVLSSGIFTFVFRAKLSRGCHIRDKSVYDRGQGFTRSLCDSVYNFPSNVSCELSRPANSNSNKHGSVL